MMYIKNHISAKLFISYLIVIVAGMAILFIAASLSIPAIYNRHMMNMYGLGDAAMGMGQRNGTMSGQLQNIREVLSEALAYAGLAAMASAVAVSFYFSRRIVSPLVRMTSASQRISKGHYDERVQEFGKDEIGQLGQSFNLMTSELEQTETRRKQLIGDISHELRTPLTAIKGSMEGLVDGVLEPSPELFLQIQGEADRLSRLVDDLQELSRVEAGAIHLDLQPVSVAQLLSITLKRLGSDDYRERVHIDAGVEELPLVMADEDRTIQVLTNLLVNAVKYSPGESEIRVTGRTEDDFAIISIRDSGVGLSKESLSRVFDRFYREDKSRSRVNGGGSGIGLTISRSLVDAQGGRIWAESDGLGKGSTFSFTIPVAS